MFGQYGDVTTIAGRLAAAAEAATQIELILVVRGKVRPVRSSHGRRWHVRVRDGRRLTFSADWVVAATVAVPPAAVRAALPRGNK